MRFIVKILLLCFLITACGSNDENLILNYKLEYEGEPLQMFNEYSYPETGENIRFKRFSFYISNVDLEGETGLSVLDVKYVNLTETHYDETTAAEGFDVEIPNSAGKDFETINLSLGISESQNQTVPADYISSNDLSLSSEYWEGWESYVYFKIEGDIDKNSDGTFGSGESFALHLGTDLVRRNLEYDVTGRDKLNFTFEVKKIFENNGEVYDIFNYPKLHTLSDENLAQMEILANNIVSSIITN